MSFYRMLIGNQNVGVLSFQGTVNGIAFSAAARHQNRTLFHFQVAELNSDRPAVNAAAANPAFLVKSANKYRRLRVLSAIVSLLPGNSRV